MIQSGLRKFVAAHTKLPHHSFPTLFRFLTFTKNFLVAAIQSSQFLDFSQTGCRRSRVFSWRHWSGSSRPWSPIRWGGQASGCKNWNRLPCQSRECEASPPDLLLSNSRSSVGVGWPPSPSDGGDGSRRSPSRNRPHLAPPRPPHRDVPSRRKTVRRVSWNKSHWLISLFLFQYYLFAKSDLDLSIDIFLYLFCILQFILLPNTMFHPIITTLDGGGE